MIKDFFNYLLIFVFNIVIGLINFLLYPIDTLIIKNIPAFDSVLSYINDFISYMTGFIAYLSSWLHLPSSFVTFVISFFTFKLTIPLIVSSTKLVIKWYDRLKL